MESDIGDWRAPLLIGCKYRPLLGRGRSFDFFSKMYVGDDGDALSIPPSPSKNVKMFSFHATHVGDVYGGVLGCSTSQVLLSVESVCPPVARRVLRLCLHSFSLFYGYSIKDG